MKKIILITAMLFNLLVYGQPQPPKEQKGKIDALKVAFITKRLDLTEEEAQKFWPVYNKYEAEKDAIRESTIGLHREDKKPVDQLTDAEADKMINDFVAFRAKDVDLMKKYVVEFKKVLPVKKVALLITAEEHFKKMLMKQAQLDGEPGPKPKPGSKPYKDPAGQ